MSILHADNFSIYGGPGNEHFMLNGVYAEVTGCDLHTDPDGVSPGWVLRPGWNHFDNGNNNWRYPFQTGPQSTGGAAFRIWQTVLPNEDNAKAVPLAFRNASNQAQAELYVRSNGGLAMRIIDHNGDLVTQYITTVPAITANAWYHIEARFDAGDGVCSFEVRVEGITVLQETNVTSGWSLIQGANVGQISARWTQIAGPQTYYIKDLVLWDDEGSYNNDFLGSVLVANLNPTADVDLNWTPSTGTDGFSILSDVPPDDAKYLSAPYNVSVPHFPDPYVATMSDLPVEATSVKAIVTYVRAAKSDGGDGSLQVGIISDPAGTPATVLGADRPITVAQTYWRDIFETDPKTTAPWLPDAVNKAELQLNRTT